MKTKNIEIAADFFNKLAIEIDKKYFPNEKWDNKISAAIHKSHYAIELFNNGCLTYGKLISTLSNLCRETQANIHKIVSKYIEDFGEYKFKPK